MKLRALLLCLLPFVAGCPSPVPAAPLDAEQVRIVKQIEQRADGAEAALKVEHEAHLDAEADAAISREDAAKLGQIAATAQADATRWKAQAQAQVRAKHHAWELLVAVLVAVVVLTALVGRQVEAMLRALGVSAVHEVLEIPGLLKWVLKLAPLLAFL